MPDDQMIEEVFPSEMAKLIDMLRPDYFDSSDGDRHWADVYFVFTVGPAPEWEVEWTGFNLPGNPNVIATAPTLAEACQKCIDQIEAARNPALGAM